MSSENPETSAALSLLNAGAVRERAHRLLAIGLEDRLPNFRVHLDRMDATAELVVETTRKAYPTLAVPFHSRWRHFAMDGVDRWTKLADQIAWHDPAARARAEFDLAMVSVFLDAGAGPSWRYHDPVTGSAIGRSEGLGLASLAMFANGVFSSDPRHPLRADADVLANFSVADLERGMQVSDSQSAGRHRRPCRSVAPPRQAGGREAGCVRKFRYAAAWRAVRSACHRWPTIAGFRPHDIVGTAAGTRADLAVAADARRDCARRLLEASDADDRRMRPAI